MISVRNITLLLASTLMIMSGAAIAPALPAIGQTFADVQGADFWVHQVLTLTGLSVALAAPLLGRFVDGSDPRHLLILSLAVAGVSGSAIFFYPDSLVLLIGSRLLLGIAVAGVMLAFTLLIANYFQGSELDKFLGLQAGVGAYSAVAYLAIGGMLAEVHWSWAFLLFLLPLFLVLPAWFSLDAVSAAAPPKGQANNAEATSWTLIGLYILGLLEAVFFYWVLVHVPFHLEANLALTASGSGFAIAGMMLSNAVVAGYYPQIRGERSHALVQGIAYFSLALGLSLFAIGGVAMLMLGLFFMGSAFGLMRPNIMRWLLTVVSPAARGKAVGLFTSAFFIGQFLSAPLAEPVIAAAGRSVAFAFAAIVVAVLGVGLVLLNAYQARIPVNEPLTSQADS